MTNETYRKILEQIYPMAPRLTPEGSGVDYHLLCLIALFATRGDLLAATFPVTGGCNPDAVYNAKLGIDSNRIKKEHICGLAPYRESFAAIQRAWLILSGYENPPCPNDQRAAKIVDFTKSL